jgi:hypothetical protein
LLSLPVGWRLDFCRNSDLPTYHQKWVDGLDLYSSRAPILFHHWVLASFGPVLCTGIAIAFASSRRRSCRIAVGAAFALPDNGRQAHDHLTPSVDVAERRLGLLLRWMRAYTSAPYNVAGSRILNAAEFEHCRDLATMLCFRLEEFIGAPAAPPLERERVRDQILLSLSATPAL